MKRYIISIAFLSFFAGFYSFSQTKEATISFNEKIHDFAKFEEAKGPVTYNFEFTNTGSTPLIISQVRASCGCTAPNWSKAPVLPGKKGFVGATYNPAGRPGPFSKTITVVSNSTTPNVILTIKGDVIPKPKTLEDEYRYSMDKIRLKTNHMSFARVIKDKTAQQTVEIINISDAPVKIGFKNVPAHLKIVAKPEVLKPNEKGVLEGIYDSKLKSDWGFVIDRVDLLLDDQYSAKNRLTVSASIEEDFGHLTAEQIAAAPRISFDNNTFNFSQVKQGEKLEHTFTVKNDGKSDLMIRKIKASCGCTAVNPADEIVKPGQSTTLRVIFDSTGKVGKQNKTITVITNDPKHSRTILWVKGEVVKS